MGSGIFQKEQLSAFTVKLYIPAATLLCGYQAENQYLASRGKCNVNCVCAKIPLFSRIFKRESLGIDLTFFPFFFLSFICSVCNSFMPSTPLVFSCLQKVLYALLFSCCCFFLQSSSQGKTQKSYCS